MICAPRPPNQGLNPAMKKSFITKAHAARAAPTQLLCLVQGSSRVVGAPTSQQPQSGCDTRQHSRPRPHQGTAQRGPPEQQNLEPGAVVIQSHEGPIGGSGAGPCPGDGNTSQNGGPFQLQQPDRISRATRAFVTTPNKPSLMGSTFRQQTPSGFLRVSTIKKPSSHRADGGGGPSRAAG